MPQVPLISPSFLMLIYADSVESEAWLNVPPVFSLGLIMSDEAIRTAMGLRGGAPLGQTHQCSYCGNDIDLFSDTV